MGPEYLGKTQWWTAQQWFEKALLDVACESAREM
jgi:hypothetical protein